MSSIVCTVCFTTNEASAVECANLGCRLPLSVWGLHPRRGHVGRPNAKVLVAPDVTASKTAPVKSLQKKNAMKREDKKADGANSPASRKAPATPLSLGKPSRAVAIGCGGYESLDVAEKKEWAKIEEDSLYTAEEIEELAKRGGVVQSAVKQEKPSRSHAPNEDSKDKPEDDEGSQEEESEEDESEGEGSEDESEGSD